MQPARAIPNPLLIAFFLSLGPALSLGLARFAYALLLPAMRADLQLSFASAGALNTANAAGYLIGAVASVGWASRLGARSVFLWGCALTVASLALCGLTRSYPLLLVLRLAAGVSSAMVFSIGGLLASKLASQHAERAGLVLGYYYSGTGLGIVLSAWLMPALLDGGSSHWQGAWLALAVLGMLATLLVWRPSACVVTQTSAAQARHPWPIKAFLPALSGYFCFGVGYIGYMTFNIALLKQHGASGPQITLFFSLLGLAVCLSSWLWAGLLDRYRDGKPLAVLNLLVGIATVLPTLSDGFVLALVSGTLFGACFLSVVASTTALVRHNLPHDHWPAGIALFTSTFALGQIVGPTAVGWLSDGAGLGKGLLCSGVVLMLGAALAWRQRPLVAAG
ncbi:MFS transporter [Chitinimonas naiadis]